MFYGIHCRQCNEQLLEPTRISEGVMDDVVTLSPGLFRDEETGLYSKVCPHCGARNGFREHHVPGRGRALLLDGLLD